MSAQDISSTLPSRIVRGEHAASLLIRRSSGELLWIKRGDQAPFLAGYWAFPGGMVDEHDLELAENEPRRALELAAIREAHEELGWGALSESAYRLTGSLRYLGAWHTHHYLPRHIEGHFFEVSADAILEALGEVPAVRDTLYAPTDSALRIVLDGEVVGELSDARWINAPLLYERWSSGAVTLAPPTLALCRAALANVPLERAQERSPELMRVNIVSPTVHLLPLRTPTLPPATHTNCYLIGGDRFFIVDPGSPYPEELERLYAEIDRRVAEGQRFEAIILTHHHADHIGGVGSLIARYQVPLAAHPLNEDLIPFQIDLTLNDGDLLVWGDTRSLSILKSPLKSGDSNALSEETRDRSDLYCWEVWHTPGHAAGHICLIESTTDIGVVGDMVAGVGTILIDPDEGEVGAYLSSLERLRDRDLSKLLPSHGPPLAAPRALLTHYIEHRKAREERVWSALPQATSINQGGGEIRWCGLNEVVAEAYADAPVIAKTGKFGGLAGRSALAHLIHLQERGRALCSEPLPRPASLWIGLGTSLELKRLSISAARLDAMMNALRRQCPWDRRQTLDSLQRYLIEESYEVLDTLTRDAEPSEHRDELGDLLFQVVFQAKIREEMESFNLADVMDGLAAKLSRRHPHVFGEVRELSAAEVSDAWRRIKAEERAQRAAESGAPLGEVAPSALDGVPRAAPALLRAQLIGEKASAVGFDWPSVQGALEKVDEERIEVAEALALGDPEAITSEIGDLLFAIVNVCRHLKISPEVALEKTNQTFGSRFRGVEKLANNRGLTLSELDIESLESLWGEVKRQAD